MPRSPVPPFAVHLLTASGAALGFAALLAAARGDWPALFAWLGLSLLVDGIDGSIARRLRVAERLPRWSGAILDLVIDYVTYVFVPAYAIAASGLIAPGWSELAGLVIVVTGALYFADQNMKTTDNYFLGFPATWSLVAFYLLLLRPPSWACVALIATLAVATFLPVAFVHPLRVARGRAVNGAMTMAWLALAGMAIVHDLQPHGAVVLALCVIGVYFIGAGALRRPPGEGV